MNFQARLLAAHLVKLNWINPRRGTRGKARWSVGEMVNLVEADLAPLLGPTPMLLWCPQCGERHVDKGEFATKPHHSHACQGCGHVWRPALVATVGVQFLPGFKDGDR